MPADVILVILYIASFAALYSLFSTRIHKMLRESKKRGQEAKSEKEVKKERSHMSRDDTTLEAVAVREREGERTCDDEERETVPEPVIVSSEDEELRKIAVQLSQDEIRVLRFLLERGGECYQMEIYRTLGLPKSTVTKIVHRLSEKGLLIVERRGRYNYVKLAQKDQVRKLVSVAQLVA